MCASLYPLWHLHCPLFKTLSFFLIERNSDSQRYFLFDKHLAVLGIKSFPSPVPVDIWTSTALPPALTGPEAQETALANLPMSNNPGGCDIDGEFYMDGMKVCLSETFHLLDNEIFASSINSLSADSKRPCKSLRPVLLHPKPHSLRDARVQPQGGGLRASLS